MAERICGKYRDDGGRVWFCIESEARPRVVCYGESRSIRNWFTVANIKTFARWAWTPVEAALSTPSQAGDAG